MWEDDYERGKPDGLALSAFVVMLTYVAIVLGLSFAWFYWVG